jgi:murein L,D-transpeptidase YcbB/YkuD
MTWDVVAEPVRHSSLNNKLIPGHYLGTAGFIQMVNEVLNLIALLEQSYSKQETFLNQIDAEIKQKGLFLGTFKKQPLTPKKITDYLIFNQHENNRMMKIINILNHLNLDRTKLFTNLRNSPHNITTQKIEMDFAQPNLNSIKSHVMENVFSSVTLNDLISSLKSHLIEDAVYLDKLFYLLIIVEEALSKAQATNAESGELVAF